MRRLSSGARVLDAVGVLQRASGEVAVRPAWTRTGGWAEGRGALQALLVEREVRVPW
jgi:hypothetical protein